MFSHLALPGHAFAYLNPGKQANFLWQFQASRTHLAAGHFKKIPSLFIALLLKERSTPCAFN